MPPAASPQPTRLGLIACGIALATACGSTPPPTPFAPEATTVQLQGFYGSPLTGTADERGAKATALEALDWSHAPLVQASLFILETHAGPVLESLPAKTRLVADLRGSTPIEPISGVTRDARVGLGEPAATFVQTLDPLGKHGPKGKTSRRAVLVETVHALVPEGCTTSLQLVPPGSSAMGSLIGNVAAPKPNTDETTPNTPNAPRRTRLAVQVHRPRAPVSDETGLVVAVSVSAPAMSPDPLAIRGECILLEDRLPVDGSPLVLVLPSPFRGSSQTYVVQLESWGADQPQTEAQTAQREAGETRMQGLLAADAEQAIGGPHLENSARLTWATAVESLRLVEDNRAALVFLASRQRAQLASDLALSADRKTLTEFVANHLASGGTLPLSPDEARSAALGVQIETNALRFLAERADNEPLRPSLDAVFISRVGALARYPDGVLEVIAQSHSLEDLDDRLLAENRNFLADSDPSTRVRAFDWLAARNEAPAGFDPLGERDERRVALKAATRAAEEAAEEAELAAEASRIGQANSEAKDTPR